MKTLGAILTFGLAAALWLFFAPTQLGGQAGYVVVTGASMEPKLQSGDLAVIRRASEYRVGDVVTYEHPELGAVIHRIVGVEGARFIVQGDNNRWTDSHQPTEQEIAGKLWIHVPSAGQYLRYLRSPGALALLSIVIGLTIMLPGRKVRPNKKPPRVSGGLPSLMEPRGRDLMSLIAILAIGALAVGWLAFTRPLERQTVTELPYEHEGVFGYTAPAPEGVYDAPQVVSGEPIFRALIDAFDVHFDYAFHSNAPYAAAGTARLQAELGTDNGWKRTFELQPATSFDGPAAPLSGRVELAELQRVIDRMQAETGIEARQYTLTIQPTIALDASVGGQSVSEQFAPSISFLMDEQQLQLMNTSTEGENVLVQGGGGLTTRAGIEANTLPLPLVELPVGTARTAALVVLGALALVAGAIVLQTLRVRRRGEPERMASVYGTRLVNVQRLPASASAATEVAGFADFQRLLEHHDGPVFQDGPTFFIDYQGQRVSHCTDPDAVAPAVIEEPPTVIEAAPAVVEFPKPAPALMPKRRQYGVSQMLFNRKRRPQRA